MVYTIYWLINKRKTKTYVGMTANVNQRLKQHQKKLVRTTRDFDGFQWKILETVEGIQEAREREKYWKSAAGRRKLKDLFKASSSSG